MRREEDRGAHTRRHEVYSSGGFKRENPLESVTTEPRLLLTDPRQVAAAREEKKNPTC